MLQRLIPVPIIRSATFSMTLLADAVFAAILVGIYAEVVANKWMSGRAVRFTGIGHPSLVTLALPPAYLALSTFCHVVRSELVSPTAQFIIRHCFPVIEYTQ